MKYLTRLALCILVANLAACMNEPPTADPSAPELTDTQPELAPEDMSRSAIYERLVNMTDIADYERDTYNDLLDMFASELAPSPDGLHAARSVCYSALTGNDNHSIIMVPLPSNTANLDAVCHLTINTGWHAGGVAKPRYYYQDCNGVLDNTFFEGGYTSYVAEPYFENHPGNYPTCNATNAMICCSPFFPN